MYGVPEEDLSSLRMELETLANVKLGQMIKEMGGCMAECLSERDGRLIMGLNGTTNPSNKTLHFSFLIKEWMNLK